MKQQKQQEQHKTFEFSCEQVQELLSAHLDGEASEQEFAQISTHLKDCKECRGYWQFLQQMQNKLSSLPEVPLPKDFGAELHAKLIAEAETQGLNTCHNLTDFEENAELKHIHAEEDLEQNKIKRPFWQKSWFPRAMAACIVLGVGLTVGNILTNDQGQVVPPGTGDLQVASSAPEDSQPVGPTAISQMPEPSAEKNIDNSDTAPQTTSGPVKDDLGAKEDTQKQYDSEVDGSSYFLVSRGNLTPRSGNGSTVMSIDILPVPESIVGGDHGVIHSLCFGDASPIVADYIMVKADEMLTAKNEVITLVGNYSGTIISNVDSCKAVKNHCCLKIKIAQDKLDDFMADVVSYGSIASKVLSAEHVDVSGNSLLVIEFATK